MKLLLVRPAALGDTLMLMPSVARLRPSTQILFVGRSPGLEILRPHVQNAIDYERSRWHRLFLKSPDEDPKPFTPRADCVVAFLGDPDGRVGANLRAYLPEASVHLFPAFPPPDARVHVALYLAQCLKKAGLPLDPEQSIEEACKRPLLREGLRAGQGQRIVFHPGSGGKGKNYPPDFWLQLIGALTHPLTKGGHIVLLGPAEEALVPFFLQKLPPREAQVLFAPELEPLQSLLAQALLYIGHDSGITHLAAMLGAPTVALFKNTPVDQWRPLGPEVRVMEAKKGAHPPILDILEASRALMGSDPAGRWEAPTSLGR